jgi:hypothetical protein
VRPADPGPEPGRGLEARSTRECYTARRRQTAWPLESRGLPAGSFSTALTWDFELRDSLPLFTYWFRIRVPPSRPGPESETTERAARPSATLVQEFLIDILNSAILMQSQLADELPCRVTNYFTYHIFILSLSYHYNGNLLIPLL